MEPTPEALPPPPEPRPAPADARPPRSPRSRRREAAIVGGFAVATMVVVALLLRFALGAADARRERQGSLATLPTPSGQCAVAPDGRILGRVVAVLGRGGRPATYRLEEYPGHGVAPAASTLTVAAGEAKLVPCADLAPKAAK